MRILSLLFLCSLLLQTTLSFAQVEGTYKIKVMALSKDFDKAALNNIKDLGVLLFESADNGYTRVYLGMYLGKTTAKQVLSEVKKRGYNSAYVVEDDMTFEGVAGDPLTHTLQFSAVKKLDVGRLVENPKMSESLRDQIYIWYSGGYYRMSLGLVTPNQSERIKQFTATIEDLGYKNPILQRFNKNIVQTETVAADKPLAISPITEVKPKTAPATSTPATAKQPTTTPASKEAAAKQPTTTPATAKQPATTTPESKEATAKQPATTPATAKQPATTTPASKEAAAKQPATTPATAKQPATTTPESKEATAKQPATSTPAIKETAKEAAKQSALAPASKEAAAKQSATKEAAKEAAKKAVIAPASKEAAAKQSAISAAAKDAAKEAATKQPAVKLPTSKQPAAKVTQDSLKSKNTK